MKDDSTNVNGDKESGEVTDSEVMKEHLRTQSMNVLEKLPALGPVIMLYMQSSHRRFQFISDLEWLLLPPLIRGQCKLYMKKKYPISFLSWAFLDSETEMKLLKNGGKLRPEDWQSGENPWIIDIVAPFGGVEQMLADVRKNEFDGKTVKIIVPDPKTGGIMTRELKPEEPSGEQVQGNSEVHPDELSIH